MTGYFWWAVYYTPIEASGEPDTVVRRPRPPDRDREDEIYNPVLGEWVPTIMLWQYDGTGGDPGFHLCSIDAAEADEIVSKHQVDRGLLRMAIGASTLHEAHQIMTHATGVVTAEQRAQIAKQLARAVSEVRSIVLLVAGQHERGSRGYRGWLRVVEQLQLAHRALRRSWWWSG